MRKSEHCGYQYFKNAEKKIDIAKIGRKVENEWEECREKKQTENQDLSTQDAYSGFCQKNTRQL